MLLSKLLLCIIITFISLFAIPAPSEYNREDFHRFLKKSELIFDGTIVSLDTITSNDTIFINAEYSVDSTYKGTFNKSSLTVTKIKQVGMIGGYEYFFKKGDRSIIGVIDNLDKNCITTGAYEKFDVHDTLVSAPLTGLGFAEDMKYYSNISDMIENIRRKLDKDELLELSPFTPVESDSVSVSFQIDISGGATLDDIVISEMSDGEYQMDVYITPCNTDFCPLLYLVIDTTLSIPATLPGTYSVYKKNIYDDIAGIYESRADTVTFTIRADQTALISNVDSDGVAKSIRSYSEGSEVQFDLSSLSLDNGNSIELSIVDLKGRVVWSGNQSDIANSKFQWSGSESSKGIYFLRINGGVISETVRFSIQ